MAGEALDLGRKEWAKGLRGVLQLGEFCKEAASEESVDVPTLTCLHFTWLKITEYLVVAKLR